MQIQEYKKTGPKLLLRKILFGCLALDLAFIFIGRWLGSLLLRLFHLCKDMHAIMKANNNSS
jgi:hypothetical protein